MSNDQTTLLDIDVSYVPTRRERNRALYSNWFVWTVCAGLAGAPVAVGGVERSPGRPPGRALRREGPR